MKNLRTPLALAGSALLLLAAAACLLRERENSRLTHFRYAQAIQLYASALPMERHLALQLLRDLPDPQRAIPLIGRRLDDADRRNRLYATRCLEELIGPVLSLPAGAERDSEGTTRMSNQASDEYVRRWQTWFKARYPQA